MSKSILESKTFWANALGIALNFAGVLPPKYAAPVLAIANIGLRLISSGEVKLVP